MPPTLSPSTVSCSIDLQASGKRVGHLRINKITNTAGWASTFIHIGCVVNGAGPTVLVLAGNHGDEYEGQVAAMRLLQELQPEQVTGRVIVIPLLSPGASKANTRNWPSGANFNRSFPGRPDGPPHEQLADYLTRVLFPVADVVIDMHSGGRSAWFLPCSHMHVVDDPAQRKAMLEAMEAWCTDYHYLYIDVNGNGLLPVEAENQGKLVITTELGELQTRASMGLPPAVIIDGRDPGNIVVAPEDGMFEAMLEPGERVAAGQPVGRLWFMDRPDRPAELLRSPVDGIVVVTKAIPITEQGDCVFVVGTPIDRAALL
jgi:predicted deacylase